MPTCIICLSDLKEPAALPCGHVFCYDCITRLIRASTPNASSHLCPTCKHSYSISNVDPQLVPHHLRSHITPSVRKLQLEYTLPAPGKAMKPTTEYEKLLAENASLRACSFVWRKRAAVHASATLGLVGLARMARDYALQMKKERDELETKYNELKALHDEKTASPKTPDTPPETDTPWQDSHIASHPKTPTPPPRLPHIADLVQPLCDMRLPPSISRVRTTSPSNFASCRPLSPSLFRVPSPADSEASVCSECADCSDCQRERELKRKRSSDASSTSEEEEAEEPPIKRSHSESPDTVPEAKMDVDVGIVAPVALSPPRAIASYLEGTLSI